MTKSRSVIMGAALLLAGCGGAPAGGNGSTATAPGATGAIASAFDAANACAILPKEKVAQVTGLAVTDAALSRVNPATAGTASFSQCTYSLAGGGSIDFFARQSPIDDNTPDAIQRTRQSVGANPVDVPGLGTAAFSVEAMHQLHVFIGGDKYIYFMSMHPPAGKPIGAVEQALARAVIG
ncbi:hypothetical protein [Sphingomonas sp. KR3-1]|uniref:hypothetical protein n=1 Tax=Sphingomonas sp. KR3-1 TaxID=3156611 RepID=UPI0032B3395A